MIVKFPTHHIQSQLCTCKTPTLARGNYHGSMLHGFLFDLSGGWVN